MEDRIRPTRSGLFSIELMIAIGVFALCAAICVGLFVRSEVSSRQSADRVRAAAEARSVSECYKAAGGDLERTAALTGGTPENGRLILRFDEGWNLLDAGDPTVLTFWLELSPVSSGELSTADVRVMEGDSQEALVSWQVSAWEVTP